MSSHLAELKANTEARLSAKNIKVIAHLPQIEGLDEVTPKNAQIVARRVCAMSYVIGLGYGAKKRKLRNWLKKYKLWSSVTPYEKKCLGTFSISEQDKANYQWMAEASQALAWSLGLVEMDHFKHCDDDLITKIPLESDPTEFIESAKLRPIEDIQKEVDLLYRMHWYARNNQLQGKQSQLSLSIIMERRRAIDWVYGTAEEWEDIDLST